MAYPRASRFRAGRCGREARRRRLSAELARVFHLARGCAISDAGRYRPHPGLLVVNPELGGGVRLPGTSRGILRRAKAKRKGADAAPFKGSGPDRLVFMLSTLSTSQAAKRGRARE